MNISRVRNKIFCSVKCIFREEIKSSIVNSSICKSWYHHETSNAIFLFFVLGCECVNYSMIKDDLIHTCICVTLTVCVSVCKHLQKKHPYLHTYECICHFIWNDCILLTCRRFGVTLSTRASPYCIIPFDPLPHSFLSLTFCEWPTFTMLA